MNRETIIEAMARAIYTAHQWSEDDNGDTLGYDGLTPEWQDMCRSYATAALSAIEAAGVRLVPAEPSRHMLVAAHMVERDDIELTEDEHRAMYAAFLAASPYARAALAAIEVE